MAVLNTAVASDLELIKEVLGDVVTEFSGVNSKHFEVFKSDIKDDTVILQIADDCDRLIIGFNAEFKEWALEAISIEGYEPLYIGLEVRDAADIEDVMVERAINEAIEEGFVFW